MFRPLYDWTLKLAAHRHAMAWLAVISFCESSFFPLPPDVIVIPMALARRDDAYRIALVCSIASVLGGALGYYIGYALYETLGSWLVHLYGLENQAAAYHDWYAKWGSAVILIKGLTPIPFKLVAIASGLAKFNFALFMAASAVTRFGRFFALAWAVKRFGARAQEAIEKRVNLFGTLFLIFLIGGFVLVKLLIHP